MVGKENDLVKFLELYKEHNGDLAAIYEMYKHDAKSPFRTKQRLYSLLRYAKLYQLISDQDVQSMRESRRDNRKMQRLLKFLEMWKKCEGDKQEVANRMHKCEGAVRKMVNGARSLGLKLDPPEAKKVKRKPIDVEEFSKCYDRLEGDRMAVRAAMGIGDDLFYKHRTKKLMRDFYGAV